MLFQELNQADISLVFKTELLDRLGAVRKAFEKQRKDKETAANKAVNDPVFLTLHKANCPLGYR